MTGSAARQQRSSLTSSWRPDNSPSKSRADGKPTSTLFWAALICGPLQHLDAHRLRPGLALELERLALGRIEVRSLAEAVTLDQSSCFASSFDSIQSISQVKHHQATHPLAIPAGLHALRIDPHNAGGAIAAVDRTVHHDARRTPGLCRYFRGHLKMRGVMSSPACRALPIKSGNRYCRCSNILAHASYHGMVDFASADGSDERGPVAAIFAATISSSPSSEAMRWRS